MSRRWYLLLLVLLIGCAATAPVPTPTNTPRPTSTPRATTIPTATERPGPTPLIRGWPHEIARNHVGLYEQEGLIVEISRVAMVTRKHFEQSQSIDLNSYTGNWLTAETFAEFIFIIHNESGKTLTIWPDEATIIIGTHQIQMNWNIRWLRGHDHVAGEIYDGVVKVGGFWIPLPRVQLEDIENIIFRFDPAHDESYNDVGDDWVFEIDMSGHPWEPADDSVTQP